MPERFFGLLWRVKMDLSEAKILLAALQQKQAAYNHAISLLFYDGDTTAPKATSDNRGRTVEVLSGEIYRLNTGSDTVSLLEYLDAHRDELDPVEKREVEVLLRDIRDMQKIPAEEYSAYQQLLVEAGDVWHTAKEKSDFALFEPYLEKIVAAVRRFAALCAPGEDAYGYWLNKYEEGLDKATCESFFSALRARLVPLIARIGQKRQVDNSLFYGQFPAEEQERFSLYLMELMGLNMDRVGLGTTEHPFTTSLGSHLDERITTHYQLDYIASSMYSVLHEGGHALYDTGCDDALAYTVLDGGVSMGIHESQSRFYENILGRSRAFCMYIAPKMRDFFPQMAPFTGEDLFRAANRVEPSLIRTEADEVTYCLHVMVRYELEKRLIDGSLQVHDLPQAWNRLYKEYLGVDVPTDREGVLQDSHWSGGAIGYFPSYALGSAYGAQLYACMKAELDPEECLAKGDFAPINAWLRENVWKFGSLKKPAEILRDIFHAPFDPMIYVDYLEEKCKAVYGL